MVSEIPVDKNTGKNFERNFDLELCCSQLLDCFSILKKEKLNKDLGTRILRELGIFTSFFFKTEKPRSLANWKKDGISDRLSDWGEYELRRIGAYVGEEKDDSLCEEKGVEYILQNLNCVKRASSNDEEVRRPYAGKLSDFFDYLREMAYRETQFYLKSLPVQPESP